MSEDTEADLLAGQQQEVMLRASGQGAVNFRNFGMFPSPACSVECTRVGKVWSQQ